MALKVHPVADLFPMLADDELAELAADIGERGLLQPIVLDAEGQVLDGRNRLAACKIAKIEPAFTTYNGNDPEGYAIAVNVERRSLSQGQKAIIIARANKRYRRNTFSEVSKQRVSHARTVLEYAPDLVDAVVSGARSLDEAYKIAQQRKQAAESTEAQMTKLRSAVPDLADQVVEERLSLSEAIAAWQQRQRERADKQRDARDLLNRITDLAAPASMSTGWVDSWAEYLGSLDDRHALAERAERAASVLLDLAERIKR